MFKRGSLKLEWFSQVKVFQPLQHMVNHLELWFNTPFTICQWQNWHEMATF